MDHMDVNPMGLDGFEFAEFTSPDPDRMAAQFEQFGFVAASTHPTKAVTRYKQAQPRRRWPRGGVPRGSWPVGERHGVPRP
jgi:4-hydroxyphenylpyruvate dioxygenase-like putative hemolysin